MWLAPEKAGGNTYTAKPDAWVAYGTLEELRTATGQEKHGREVDYNIFERLVAPSQNRHEVYHAMDLNFRLKAGSAAVDAGVPIPTVNEGFLGKAPDLGALESGAPEPHYGPTWLKWQPFYR